MFEVEEENCRRFHEEAINSCPTNLENPYGHWLLRKAVQELEAVLPEIGWELPPQPVAATFATGEVNAFASGVPGIQESLVVVEDGLFHFVNLMSKAVASVIPLTNHENDISSFSVRAEDCAEALRQRPDALERFFEVMVAYLVVGSPSAARPYLLDRPAMVLAHSIWSGMLLFVVGHEYGHVIHGHFGPEHLEREKACKDEVDLIKLNFLYEFQADAVGLELTLRAMFRRGYDLALSFTGADFLLRCLQVADESRALIARGSKVLDFSTTHPPIFKRREYLRRHLEHDFPKDRAELAVSHAARIDEVVTLLFNGIELRLSDLHRRGVQLATGPPAPIRSHDLPT